MKENKRDVLFTDGDFRLVKIERGWSGDGAFVQHHHPELTGSAMYNNTSFDWEGWIYCLGVNGSCTQCKLKIPEAMGGLMKLENWDR